MLSTFISKRSSQNSCLFWWIFGRYNYLKKGWKSQRPFHEHLWRWMPLRFVNSARCEVGALRCAPSGSFLGSAWIAALISAGHRPRQKLQAVCIALTLIFVRIMINFLPRKLWIEWANVFSWKCKMTFVERNGHKWEKTRHAQRARAGVQGGDICCKKWPQVKNMDMM